MADVAGILERVVLGGDASVLQTLEPEAWSEAQSRAIDEGVAGWLYWQSVCGRWSVPTEVGAVWQRAYRENAGRNLVALERLSHCLAGWREAGIEALVLPGAPLLAYYPDLGCRSMVDVDILVDEGSALAVAAWLRAAGFSSPKRYPDLFIGDGLVLDIHTDLFHSERIAARGHVGQMHFEEMRARAVEYDVSGFVLPAPCAEDALLYCSAHVLRHSYSRLGWLLDLRLLIERSVEEETVLHRANVASMQRPLLYALLFLRRYTALPTQLARWSSERSVGAGEQWLMRRMWRERRDRALGDFLWAFSIDGAWRRAQFILETAFPRPAVLMQIFSFLPNSLLPLAYVLRLGQLLLRGGRLLTSMVRSAG